MKVSIITCCWNSGKFIKNCIDSIDAQDYKNIEVIFVDGGSSDNTLSLIKGTKSTYKVLHNIRGGIAAAMNAGVECASGDLIIHLHADDYFYSSRSVGELAACFKDDQVQWAFGRFKNDADGVVSDPPYEHRRYSMSTLLRRNIVPHCSTAIRRSVFHKFGGFDTNFRLAMDYDLWLRLSKETSPKQIDSYIGVFRRHAQSSTTAQKSRSFNEDFKARFKHSSLVLWPEFVLRYIYRRFREV